jgi:acetyltransferase-like isoleucine patch superfamily enzyme
MAANAVETPFIGGLIAKLCKAVYSILDPRAYFHVFRLVHYYNYSHISEKRLMAIGSDTGLAPNVSIRNGARIRVGHDCHIGERCYLWAGDETGRIVIGDYTSLAPEVFITASDYQFEAGRPFSQQPRRERDVVIGSDVWLGARVVVTAGVKIGDGAIVGAGAVVTRDIPAGTIAVGVPARVVAERPKAGIGV